MEESIDKEVIVKVSDRVSKERKTLDVPISTPISTSTAILKRIRKYFKDIGPFEIRYMSKKQEKTMSAQNLKELSNLLISR